MGIDANHPRRTIVDGGKDHQAIIGQVQSRRRGDHPGAPHLPGPFWWPQASAETRGELERIHTEGCRVITGASAPSGCGRNTRSGVPQPLSHHPRTGDPRLHARLGTSPATRLVHEPTHQRPVHAAHGHAGRGTIRRRGRTRRRRIGRSA